MPTTINIRKARTRLPRLLRRVELGEEIVIRGTAPRPTILVDTLLDGEQRSAGPSRLASAEDIGAPPNRTRRTGSAVGL